jgi:hypothetical protein
MNNPFDPKSLLGSAFNDIFGAAVDANPKAPPSQAAGKKPEPVARMGTSSPMANPTAVS